MTYAILVANQSATSCLKVVSFSANAQHWGDPVSNFMNAKHYFPQNPLRAAVGRAFFPGLILLFFAACTEPAAQSDEDLEGRQIRVVTTATMVKDMVEAIGGDRVAVDSLMGPGVDPHLFRPSVMDLRRVERSEGIFYVGLRFEELMENVLEQRKRAGQKVFALTDSIPREKLLESDDGAGIYDPHVWFDVDLWSHCVDAVLEGLIELGPNYQAEFEERAEAYRLQLADLHEWALEKAAELPEDKRILVTSHDAYNYFGEAYGFQVVGLMGISTASEAGLADITRLVDFIGENDINAIFVESSVSPRAIERVARDANVEIGGELFSDALGPPGEKRLDFDVGTYDGMIRYNLTTIVDALR